MYLKKLEHAGWEHLLFTLDALDSAGKNCKHYFWDVNMSQFNIRHKNLQYLISSQKPPLSQKVRKLLKGGLNVLNVALFKFILWKRKKAKCNENRPFHGFFNFWHGSGAVNASKTMRKPL